MRLFIACVAACVLAAHPAVVRLATAEERSVRLGFGIDIASGNAANDDHYTATFRLFYATSHFRVRLEERMFTDERAGTRFDETRTHNEYGLRERHFNVAVNIPLP